MEKKMENETETGIFVAYRGLHWAYITFSLSLGGSGELSYHGKENGNY